MNQWHCSFAYGAPDSSKFTCPISLEIWLHSHADVKLYPVWRLCQLSLSEIGLTCSDIRFIFSQRWVNQCTALEENVFQKLLARLWSHKPRNNSRMTLHFTGVILVQNQKKVLISLSLIQSQFQSMAIIWVPPINCGSDLYHNKNNPLSVQLIFH